MSKEAILIHGWDPNYYNKNVAANSSENIAWSHRPDLIRLLSEHYDLEYFNLPGFAGVPEPKERYYDVEDFTDRLASWIGSNEKDPKVIIGYSFGGAVALDYKSRYKTNTPVVLISPAIVRQESAKSTIGNTAKQIVPPSLISPLKDVYQKIFSRYYRLGTPFLRSSYDHIVRRDLSSLLDEVDPGGALLIYGNKDTSTPWHLVEQKVKAAGLDYEIIEGGGHNIGQTHPDNIVAAINQFLD